MGEHAARNRKHRRRKRVGFDEFKCKLLEVLNVITLNLSGSLPAMRDKIEAAGFEAGVKVGSRAVILEFQSKFVAGAEHLT